MICTIRINEINSLERPLFNRFLNSTNFIEQKYIKKFNLEILRDIFEKKMLTKFLVKF